jgi:transposase-like protein
MDISSLPDPSQFKYKWKSPYDFNNTFAVPHIYAISYEGVIKYVGKSTGTRFNYYTGGVIPNKIKKVGIKGVLEFVTEESIDEAEVKWIAEFKPQFNIAAGGRGGLVGYLNPAKRKEVREKISQKAKDRKLTKEHKEKLRQAKLNNPVRAHLGKKRSIQTITKIKETYARRREHKNDKIVDMLQQGYYVNEIVSTLNVSTSTVAKLKNQLGLKGKHSRARRSLSPLHKN